MEEEDVEREGEEEVVDAVAGREACGLARGVRVRSPRYGGRLSWTSGK